MMFTRGKSHDLDNGNALFLILIAVALFAALSYAITSSGRGSDSISKETAALEAARMTQEYANIRAAVDRMILTGTPAASVEMSYIDFPFTTYCTTGINCVFAPEGGGVAVPKGALPANFTYVPFDLRYTSTAFPGIATSSNDGYIVQGSISEAVCRAVNNGLNISSIPANIASIPSGKIAACIGSGTIYAYYHVMIEQ